MTVNAITIQMDENDFDALSSTSMRWAGHGWEDQINRFEGTAEDAPGVRPVFSWAIAYWVGDSWANVILARSFLAAMGEESAVVWDDTEPPEYPPGYVILTDFETRSWRESKHKVLLIETNSDLVYARLADGPLWFFGPVTPDMYGKFGETAAAWAAGEWEPHENDGQRAGSWAEGMRTAAVLAPGPEGLFFPHGLDALGGAARLWLLGESEPAATVAADVTDDDIRQLRKEAGSAGDTDQVRLCGLALDGHARAHQQCAEVIGYARIRASEDGGDL